MNWNDDQDAVTGPRPCERCGAGASTIDSMQAAQYAMCRELLLGDHRHGWLCYDCCNRWLMCRANDLRYNAMIVAELTYDLRRARAAQLGATAVMAEEWQASVSNLLEAKQQFDTLAVEFLQG